MSKKEEQEPYFRLLVCKNCRTIDELPSAEEDPGDTLLNITVERHGDMHYGRLWNVPKAVWMTPALKEDVIKQLSGGEGDGLGLPFYNTRMQFAEDAMTCYSIHNRPKGQCPDYKSDKKKLSAGTEQMRKAENLNKYAGPTVYLCDFCPVKSFNMVKTHDKIKAFD
jgi:hypothetical protein